MGLGTLRDVSLKQVFELATQWRSVLRDEDHDQLQKKEIIARK